MTKDQKEVLDEVIRLSRELESLKQRVTQQETLIAEGAEIVEVLTLDSRNLCWGEFRNKVAVWRDKAKGAR